MTSRPCPDRILCDGFGCNESHPVDHEAIGEPNYEPGRWLGWLYLDVNNPRVAERELRFCSVACLTWWIEWAARKPVRVTELDRALKAARLGDELGPRRRSS